MRERLNVRQAETVERLLHAGLEELRVVGHEALTIRTVAQRAQLSPATAYTYLASKNHLLAELFARHLATLPPIHCPERSALARVQRATRVLARRMSDEPALTVAVIPALLGSDPDVARLGERIGVELRSRFEVALSDGGAGPVAADVLEAVVLVFSGALLRAGMGLDGFDELADRLDPILAVVMRGNE